MMWGSFFAMCSAESAWRPPYIGQYLHVAANGGFSLLLSEFERELGKMNTIRAKCLVVGPPASGKTSLLSRVVKGADDFPKNYTMTPGVEISTKIIQIPDTDDRVEFIFFDLSGHTFYSKLVHRVAIQPALFISVYDVTEDNALNAANEWIEFVKKMGGDINVPGILIANKTDLHDLRVISPKAGLELANSQGIQYLETSVKDGVGVEEPFFYLANEWYKLYLDKADGFKTYMVN